MQETCLRNESTVPKLREAVKDLGVDGDAGEQTLLTHFTQQLNRRGMESGTVVISIVM